MTSDPTQQARWAFLSRLQTPFRRPQVVDIGANPLDVPPYQGLLEAGLIHVIGFEPQMEAFAKLEASKSENETYLHCAVGTGQPIELNLYRQSGLTSIFKLDNSTTTLMNRNPKQAECIGTAEVPTFRLDDIDEIDDIDLLKIDVQGAEVMIFENGRKKLADALCVISELRFFPMYVDEPALDEQISVLRSLGFLLHRFLSLKVQPIGNSKTSCLKNYRLAHQLLDGDGIFLRDLRNIKAIPTPKLFSLALLADAILESYDLVLLCLDELVARVEISDEIPAKYIDLLPGGLRHG